jgi:hypothetical protein
MSNIDIMNDREKTVYMYGYTDGQKSSGERQANRAILSYMQEREREENVRNVLSFVTGIILGGLFCWLVF